jgi:hypothetical protein
LKAGLFRAILQTDVFESFNQEGAYSKSRPDIADGFRGDIPYYFQ